MRAREVRILFRKEWRQLLRSRAAMLTSLIIPLLLLVIVPSGQMLGIAFGDPEQTKIPVNVPLPPALAAVAENPREMAKLMLPLFIALGGMIVPMVAASYTVVGEREGRTLELLIALPITLGQILMAKLAALMTLASGVTLALFTIDAAVLLLTGLGDVALVFALAALLVSSLFFSASGALLVSLLAKDFRTSNNLSGIIIVPVLLLAMLSVVTIPGTTRAALFLAGTFFVGAIVFAVLSTRVVTFERLLR